MENHELSGHDSRSLRAKFLELSPKERAAFLMNVNTEHALLAKDHSK